MTDPRKTTRHGTKTKTAPASQAATSTQALPHAVLGAQTLTVDVPATALRCEIDALELFDSDSHGLPRLIAERLKAAGFDMTAGAPPIHQRNGDLVSDAAMVFEQRRTPARSHVQIPLMTDPMRYGMWPPMQVPTRLTEVRGKTAEYPRECQPARKTERGPSILGGLVKGVRLWFHQPSRWCPCAKCANARQGLETR